MGMTGQSMNVELIYERTCPNVEAARMQLREACRRVRVTETWQEWEVGDPQSPDYARKHGSPTILVNGADVSADGSHTDGACCRVYATGHGYQPVPTVEQITSAMHNARLEGRSRGLAVATLPPEGSHNA